ncbi:methyltransferase domain-containing protein [Rhodohalobacter sp. SW132]|uniref:class I SAM-dependent methyltransferase n=1 Tax=Rhodohalobacter sp. SW132 TaxID=2293433 RepID=UPI000E232984|nr:methyltransferase domain-containing protein [Rhodohalobacter sp. SW132]REL39037.1 methyltransferase domain-containing protein [Rhodohalobacter sp. SW132]
MADSSDKNIQKTVGHYDRLSKKYDKGYSAYLKHTHDKFMDRLNFSPGDHILDISGGTGILAEQILLKFPDVKITLNDPSDGMLQIAKKRLKKFNHVAFTSHPAEKLPFEKNRFDHITCLNSFHYYTDQHLVTESMRTVLKPEGTVKILDWNREGWFHLPNKIISLLSPENINTRSLSELKTLLTGSGFDISSEAHWSFRFWKFFYVEATYRGSPIRHVNSNSNS